MEDQGGDLRRIRDDARRLLDRIDTRLLERQEQQDSKQREQILTRLLRASGIAVVLGLAWGWLRGRQREVVVAAVTVVAGSAAVLAPSVEDDAGEEPSLVEPRPYTVAPPEEEREPAPSATVTIQAAEPTPDGSTPPVEVDVRIVEPSVAPTVAEPEPTVGTFTPTPTPTLIPTPTPTQLPTQVPLGETEDMTVESCLELDVRPATDLGACVRELLGLVE